MKKIWLIGAVLVLGVLALGVVGFAYAQELDPPQPFSPYGPGMMGGSGMMGGWRDNGVGSYGPMHDFMLEAWAEALDVSVEELQSRLNEGDTMWTIAQEKGLSQEEFFSLMSSVHQVALDEAVEEGVITQQQADWMSSHMGGRWGSGGFGSCHGGGYAPGRGPGGRWNMQPTLPES